MSTVKLVIIGSSGVGKTSLRGQFISSRFSTGYRATIGADFISKTLPHPMNAEDSVTLQIWDTAGQERFSSLSSAFFRGADAALLMFDVNTPETMLALKNWWEEFRDKRPLADEELEDFCVVCVGNKIDLTTSKEGLTNNNHLSEINRKANQEASAAVVSEEEATKFLQDLIPQTSTASLANHWPPSSSSDSNQAVTPTGVDSSQMTVKPAAPSSSSIPEAIEIPPSSPRPNLVRTRSRSLNSNEIYLGPAPSPPLSSYSPPFTRRTHNSSDPSSSLSPPRRRHRSQSSNGLTIGTMTSGKSIYHTPASSFYDAFESARPSPEPYSTSFHRFPSQQSSDSRNRSLSGVKSSKPRRLSTAGSAISGTTITPGLVASRPSSSNMRNASPIEISRMNSSSTESPTLNARNTIPSPPTPVTHPALFFTSAKTGQGVSEVFEYVASRVARRWAWEEHRMDMLEAGTDSLGKSSKMARGKRWFWRRGDDAVDLDGNAVQREGLCC